MHHFWPCMCSKNRKSASQRARNLVRRMVSPSSDSSWYIICLEPLLDCQCCPRLWLHVHLRETCFLGLGLTVIEEKVQKQDFKNIKNVKRCRDGMQKVCKQGRDDIIIAMVNLQSPIPTSFTLQLQTSVKAM